MRPLVLGTLMLHCALAKPQGQSIVDFNGPNPLAGWSIGRATGPSGASGSLIPAQGHAGRGLALEYRFNCVGSSECGVAAVWTPNQPLKIKRKGAVSMWVHAGPAVKLTLLVTDKNEGLKRYPFEAVTLENPNGDWRRVSIPLAARSTGYGDETHNGAPEGKVTSLGLLVEARYPQTLRGAVAFDDIRLMESAEQTYLLDPRAPLTTPAKGTAELTPRLGVNIHSLADYGPLDRAKQAGFHFVRADLLWRQTERNGTFRFFAYDRLMNALDARGMGALWILDYGHPQHGGDHPRTPEDIAAFAKFAEAVAAHFKGGNARYEIWNEPNIERFWPPAPDAAQYAALLREAVAAIHRADPEARVASGGLARIDLPFLDQTIAAGATSQVNAVAVHPYRRTPETLAADWPSLRELVTQKLGPQVELWNTEWGYASYDYFSKNLSGDGHSAPGRKRQAMLTAREALTIWAMDLPLSIWYDLRDDGDDPRKGDDNYGLLDRSGADKPAMTALCQVTHLAADHKYAGMVANAPDGVHILRLDGASDHVFVVWNDQPDAQAVLQFPQDGSAGGVNLFGEPLKIKGGKHSNSEIALPETEGPVYLTYR